MQAGYGEASLAMEMERYDFGKICLKSKGLGTGLNMERGEVEREQGIRMMPWFLPEQPGG